MSFISEEDILAICTFGIFRYRETRIQRDLRNGRVNLRRFKYCIQITEPEDYKCQNTLKILFVK